MIDLFLEKGFQYFDTAMKDYAPKKGESRGTNRTNKRSQKPEQTL